MDITNESDAMNSYYADDFITRDKNGNLIDNKLVFRYPKTLFNKLKPQQRVAFSVKLEKNNCKNGGAAFSPVSTVAYKFKRDQKSN